MSDTTKNNSKKSSEGWIRSIIISIVIASVVRWGIFENFKIPSPSMEGTLLTGDIVLVSKLHYGPRFPITPLQVPLTHQKIWGTNIKSYLDIIKLPYIRFFGFSRIKRNDKIVFNIPTETRYPTDLKTFYIKRCIGLPGEEISIDKGQIIINKKPIKDPKGTFYKYYFSSTKLLDDAFFNDLKIQDYAIVESDPTGANLLTQPEQPQPEQPHKESSYNGYAGKYYKYLVFVSSETALKLKVFPFISSIEKYILPEEFSMSEFLGVPYHKWNLDFMGPFKVPKKGIKIIVNEESLAIYKTVIIDYENNSNTQIKDGELYIDNVLHKEYTFKQNYYFMMGDNRHNSKDSRIIGFVPKDHIVGKAIFILFSKDNTVKGNILRKIRWNRIFRNYE